MSGVKGHRLPLHAGVRPLRVDRRFIVEIKTTGPLVLPCSPFLAPHRKVLPVLNATCKCVVPRLGTNTAVLGTRCNGSPYHRERRPILGHAHLNSTEPLAHVAPSAPRGCRRPDVHCDERALFTSARTAWDDVACSGLCYRATPFLASTDDAFDARVPRTHSPRRSLLVRQPPLPHLYPRQNPRYLREFWRGPLILLVAEQCTFVEKGLPCGCGALTHTSKCLDGRQAFQGPSRAA